MKKITLLALIILINLAVSAQNGYVISTLAGSGISSSSFDPLHPYGAGNGASVMSNQYQVNIGYVKGRWKMETGLGYLTTGVSFTSPYTVPGCGLGPMPADSNKQQGENPAPTPTPAISNRFTEIRTHITVPVSVSYQLFKFGKFSVSPGAGILLMYNAYNKITSNLSTFEESGYQDPFQLNTFSGALLLKADVAYKINKQWSIVCGPSMECMFSSLTTKIEGESMSRIYDYSYLLNLGVSYRIL